jgi:ABC-type sugar transport system substrate-binding protein
MGRKGIFALLLALTLALGACGAGAPRLSGYKYVVGVSQSNLIEPSQIAIHDQMQAHAREYPDLRLVFSDAVGDSARQADDIRQLLKLDVDLLIVTPVNAVDLGGVLAAARKKVPVIVLGSKINGGNYDMFIGPDDYEVGYQSGLCVASLLGEAGGAVLEISGQQDSLRAQQISAGFSGALAQHPQVRLLETLNGEWLRDTAERRMKDFLIQGTAADVVFAHSDAMAYGAWRAAQDLRVNDIRFLGVGGQQEEGKLWVDQGILTSTFYCNTGASQAIDWAVKILQGAKDAPRELVFEPVYYAGSD